jgi:phosphoribosylglycinamide formyltransferase-1
LLKIAVLISGGGSNLQSVIDSIEKDNLDVSIECVISDKPGVFGLERAAKHGISTYVVDRKEHGANLSDEIYKITYGKVDLVVLAGFLSILKGKLIASFKDRIINIHPSLIPSFCGNGMYGLKVHKKVIESGVKVSGCTVHFVDEETDQGPIIIQEAVPVYFEDTAEELQKRVLVKEHLALPSAIKLISENKVKIVDNRVCIEK